MDFDVACAVVVVVPTVRRLFVADVLMLVNLGAGRAINCFADMVVFAELVVFERFPTVDGAGFDTLFDVVFIGLFTEGRV